MMKHLTTILAALFFCNMTIAANLPPEITSISYAPHYTNTVMYGDTVLINGYNLCPEPCNDYTDLSVSMNSSYGNLPAGATVVYANNNSAIFHMPIFADDSAITYTTPFGSITSTSTVATAPFSFTPREVRAGEYIFIFLKAQTCDGSCKTKVFIGNSNTEVAYVTRNENLVIGKVLPGSDSGLISVVADGGVFWQSNSKVTILE